MKRVLSICDSIANTRYSAQLCVDTYTDYNVEPMLAVPEFTDGESIEQTDIEEVLDYCLKLDINAVHIGLIRDPEAVSIVADGLSKYDHPAVVAEPSIISPDGRILVSRDTYDAFTESLVQHIHFLVLNIYEAELFSGIECHGPADARQAADVICEKFHCVVFVGGCKKTLGRDLLVIGGKAKWYEGTASRSSKSKKHFTAAVACELASDKSIGDAVTAARFFCGISTGSDYENDQTFEYMKRRREALKSLLRNPHPRPPLPLLQSPPAFSISLKSAAVRSPSLRSSLSPRLKKSRCSPKVQSFLQLHPSAPSFLLQRASGTRQGPLIPYPPASSSATAACSFPATASSRRNSLRGRDRSLRLPVA